MVSLCNMKNSESFIRNERLIFVSTRVTEGFLGFETHAVFAENIHTLNPTLKCLLIKVKSGRSTRGMLCTINEFRIEFFPARSFVSEFN